MRNLTQPMHCAFFIVALLALSRLGAQESAVAEPEATAADTKSANSVGADSKASEAQPLKKTKFKVAMIEFKGPLKEGPVSDDPFGVTESNLSEMLQRLEKAADDEKVQTVVLRMNGVAVGRGTLHELREGIDQLKASGKSVLATIDMGTTADFLVACACDRIIMPESGSLIIPGIRAELTFFKNLFEKLAIEPDMVQVGDFKGAAEPYMREKMSAEFREQYNVVLDDYYAQMVEVIAADRGLDGSRVRELIDIGMFSADEAKAAGLIDEVAYDHDWQQNLLADRENTELDLLEDYAKKKIDTDFSGMAGFVKMLDLLSGGSSKSRKSKKQKIAVVYAVGVIMPGESGNSFLQGQSMGSDTMVEAIREVSEDDKVAGIVLRVDSPGGSALASDLIWNAIEQTDKPVVASMGNIAASGGYYISMGCDKIYAEPGTLTGSIGVVGGKLAMGGMFEKFGLTTDVIAHGKNSGMFSTTDKFSDSERKVIRRSMEDVYRLFTSKAASGRDMEVADLLKLAGGRVWTGRQAKANGLVDEVGTLEDAIDAVKEMAGIDADAEVELLEVPEPKSVFEQLFGANVRSPQLDFVPDEVTRRLRYLKQIEVLMEERVLTVLPYQVEIR